MKTKHITKRKTKKQKNSTSKKTKLVFIIKKNKPKIVYNTRFLRKQEKYAAYRQGKGFGASSIKEEEVNSCISLLSLTNNTPKIFIDIGAHKGLYTQEVLKYFPDIQAYLFEPSPFNTEILKKNFLNLHNVNISINALSNITGKQKIYFDKPGSELTSLTKRRVDHFKMHMNFSEDIETSRFDDFWKSTDNYKNNPDTIIDYVKIDVEGHELDVLEGFGSLIKNIGLIQFEFGGANIDTRTFFQDFWYFFKNKIYNFSIYRISPHGLIPITRYLETDEYFSTTNYIDVNNKINKK